MIIRIRYEQAGGHIHCTVFTAKERNQTFARAGNLVFNEEEWPKVQEAMGNVQFVPVGATFVETCKDCGNEIDPDYCHCGSKMEEHTQSDNHFAIPMGCACFKDKA